MKILKLLVFFFFLFASAFPALASNSDFYIKTRLNTDYFDSGESHSKLQLTIRNLTSASYPTLLKVNIHGDKINILSARDDYGDLSFVYTYQPSGINSVDLKLNRRLVGKNVLTHIYLVYEGQEAQRTENTWVVFYPKIDLTSPGDFAYTITVPDSFGRLIAAENLQDIDIISKPSSYTLSGSSLNLSSRLIFGNSYPYSFTLSYPVSHQIILPNDTPSQKIYLTSIKPSPASLELKNNFWVGLYTDAPSDITVSGYAVFFEDKNNLDIPEVNGFSSPEKINLQSHPYQYLPAKPVSISVKSPSFFWPFIKNNINLEVENPNFQALYNVSLSLQSSGFNILDEQNPVIQVLLPSGKISLPVGLSLSPKHLFSPKFLDITVSGQHFSYNLSRSSLTLYYLTNYVLISIVIIITIYFAVLSRSLYIQRFRK